MIGEAKMNKTFKTIDEQIVILKDKGIVIDDESYTKEILLREKLLFINGIAFILISPSQRYFLFLILNLENYMRCLILIVK
jgi:hypothetical protein